ncbi:hypothetical protein AAFN88_19590 [Pelagibius sp. CAU 1746]|uniref:hypothetical protein n=1 Tax=Pelagibius sp. CAU 1746 TaxID=3140370 RepID=UPI00325AC72F
MEKKMPRRFAVRILAVASLLVPAAIGATALAVDNAAAVTREELTAALNSKDIDGILMVTNAIKRMRHKDSILPVVQAVWRQDRRALPDVDWETASFPAVRVEMANILLQADRNGLLDADVAGIATYLRGRMADTSGHTLGQVILTLGLLDTAEDVPAIYAVAEQQDSPTFGAAVIALSRMCDPAADAALDALEGTVGDQGEVYFLGGVTPLGYIRDVRASFTNTRKYCSD